MEKTLKFPQHYAKAILAKDIGTTTRLFDEKDLSVGDEVAFLEKETGRCFARAKITKVVESPFSEIVKQAADVKRMYDQYAVYYQTAIESTTPVKTISFQILERRSLPDQS